MDKYSTADLGALHDRLSAEFTSRLEESSRRTAGALQQELQHQAAVLRDDFRSSTDRLVESIQNLSEHMGTALHDIRWEITSLSKVSKKILDTLLTPLDTESREFWRQGVDCYRVREYELAEDRFKRALEKQSTNYFAYQYLGFIAVHTGRAPEALRHFDLATKFAEDGYHRALAFSHLARTRFIIDDLPRAIECSTEARNAAPRHAVFWYEAAMYHGRALQISEAARCLREAISQDWKFWSTSFIDATLDPIRSQVEELRETMREEQRRIADEALNSFASTIGAIERIGIGTEIQVSVRCFQSLHGKYCTGTVFAYRDLVQPARNGERDALRTAIFVLQQWIETRRTAIAEAEKAQAEIVSKARARIAKAEREAAVKKASDSWQAGCLPIVIVLVVLGLAFGLYHATSFWLVVLAVGILWIPVAHFFESTLPTREIRKTIGRLRNDCERIENQSNERLAAEVRRLNGEIATLGTKQQECQVSLDRFEKPKIWIPKLGATIRRDSLGTS